MAEQPAQRRIFWQDFELDLHLRRLHRDGQRIGLQPIPFQILAMLLERPGELVTREELHHKIWNGYSYGDFDHSLNIAISKLRTVLGDSAKELRFIETLPQIGYRFMAPVEKKGAAQSGGEIIAQGALAREMWLRPTTALAAAVIVLGLAGYWAGRQVFWPEEPADSAEAAQLDRVGVPPGRVAYVFPTPGNASFRFTGGGADYVRIPNNPLLEPENVTVDAWVRAAGSPGRYRYIVAKGADACGGSSYALYTGTNGGLVFYIAGPPKLLAVPSPPASSTIWDGKWHHVAGIFDGSVVRLYVDGAEVGFGARRPKKSSIVYDLSTNNDLLIGNYVGGCTAPFNGEIGEVQVFDRAISQTEIATLFKVGAVRYNDSRPLSFPSAKAEVACVPPPAGLMGKWTAERDLSEEIHRLQPFQVGGVNRAAGKVGVGIEFLGNGHMEFRDAPRFNLTGPLTLEGWVYYKGFEISPQDGGVLVAKWGDPASRSPSYGLFVRSNGVPFFAISSDGVRATRAEATLPLVVEMTHLAGVWDGTTMRLYANGVPVAEAPFAGPIRGGAGPLYMGGRLNAATGEEEAIAGTLDEIGLYNRALTEKEILAIYRAGSVGKCR